MEWFITSACSGRTDFTGVVDELVSLGFRNIELTGNIRYSEGIEKKILEYHNLRGINFMVHNYLALQPDEFVFNLATKNPDIKRKTMEQVKNTVSLLRRMGKDLYSFHPGFRYDLNPMLQDNFFTRKDIAVNSERGFYGTLKNILREIIKDNFRVAVENIHPKSRQDLYSFLCTPEDIERFLNYFGDSSDNKNIGILLDLGHLNIAAARLNFDKFEALSKIVRDHKERIFEIHISENDGFNDTHGITGLDSWQVKFLAQHKKDLKNMPIILEWHNSATGEAFNISEEIRGALGN